MFKCICMIISNITFFAVMVTDKDIQDVASKANLDYNQLQKLFVELEITQRDIEKQQRIAETKDYEIQAKHVLQFWRQTNGKLATRRKILDALMECTLIEAKDLLVDTWGITFEGRYE